MNHNYRPFNDEMKDKNSLVDVFISCLIIEMYEKYAFSTLILSVIFLAIKYPQDITVFKLYSPKYRFTLKVNRDCPVFLIDRVVNNFLPP